MFIAQAAGVKSLRYNAGYFISQRLVRIRKKKSKLM
jgi:hypothetical protein